LWGAAAREGSDGFSWTGAAGHGERDGKQYGRWQNSHRANDIAWKNRRPSQASNPERSDSEVRRSVPRAERVVGGEEAAESHACHLCLRRRSVCGADTMDTTGAVCQNVALTGTRQRQVVGRFSRTSRREGMLKRWPKTATGCRWGRLVEIAGAGSR